jgi:hypothetical protein
MRALYRTGRQTDALKTFHRLRDKLDADLGIEPGPALRDLETAILHQDPGPDPPSREIAPARRRPARPVPAQLPPEPHGFVGRAAELAGLDSTLDGAGRPAVVAIATRARCGRCCPDPPTA